MLKISAKGCPRLASFLNVSMCILRFVFPDRHDALRGHVSVYKYKGSYFDLLRDVVCVCRYITIFILCCVNLAFTSQKNLPCIIYYIKNYLVTLF